MRSGWKTAATLCALALFAIGADLLIGRFYNIPLNQQQQQTRWAGDDQAIAKQAEANAPRPPTIIGLLTGGDLQREAAYCGDQTQEAKDKWMLDYRCGIKQTDVVAALASIALVFLTIGLIVVGLLQYWVYNWQASLMSGQLSEAKRSADVAAGSLEIAEKSFTVSQRPWLSVEATEIEPMQIVSTVGFSLNLELRITNIGATPALDVVSRLAFIPDNAVIQDEQKALSAVVRASVAKRSERFGPSIFPNEKTIINSQFNHNVLGEDAQNYRTKEHITGYIIGCVDYEFALGGRGQTRTM